MAIRHSITLSTSEPNNEVGNLKIRQGDEQTQTLVANITENGVPKPFVGLQPFFCAKLGQTAGLGIIEQKVTGTMNPANGTLEYVMQPEDWQQLGRQTAYFSFRKMVNDHEWTEQFSTRDFNYNVTKSVFSEGVKETKKDGSTYIWTIEDLIRLFNEYMASGKSDWEEFVEQNREILESVDPGGELLSEIIVARGEAYQTLGERLDEEKAEVSGEIFQTIKKNTNNIVNVNYYENIDAALLDMSSNKTLFITGEYIIDKPIVLKNMNNIKFVVDGVLKVSDSFPNTEKNIVKFDNCTNVEFKGCVDLENKILLNNDGMNFIVLFRDCENVNVVDTIILNGKNIKGLSSSINFVNGSRACKNANVKNLLVDNCRSAVFTQYRNNTIENVKAFRTNDAIIALNSENCINSYVNNCYANYNDAFPLVAIENNAYGVTVENCIAENTRGLVEIFSLDLEVVNNYPNTLTTTIIRDSKHIINDENFIFNSTVTLTSLSFRRGIEKYSNIIIDNVELINTTTKSSQYLAISDTNINNYKIESLLLKNIKITTKNIRDFLILFNCNANKITIEDMYVDSNSPRIGIRTSRSDIVIDEFYIRDGKIKGLERFLSYDFPYNDFIKNFYIENVRFTNTSVMCVNFPNGTITIDDYNKNMLVDNYVITNKGCSRVSYSRDRQPPTVGKWFKGDIAINKFNAEEYYYDGTNWHKRNLVVVQ